MDVIGRLNEALFAEPNHQDERTANFPLPSDPKWASLKARITRVACKQEPFFQSQELEEKFRALYDACESNHVAPKDLILDQIIPFIASMASQVDDLFTDGAPLLLLQGQANTVELSQAQCCCLLGLAFFDALPGPPDQLEMPGEFSFSYWLSNEPEKTKCLLHYFLRLMRRAEAAAAAGNAAQGWGRRTVAFTRKILADPAAAVSLAALQASEVPLGDFAVEGATARIEDAQGALRADFANEFLGGGALDGGCVQEEILFAVTPECLVGMLLCERMALNEAVEISGAERFCAYTGYADSFRFAGGHEDAAPATGAGGRLAARWVALDAEVVCSYRSDRAQYGPGCILREMTKLAAALAPGPEEGAAAAAAGGRAAFATGNWGCGAFGGDPQLKSLLQWAAASLAGRGVRYFPFADRRVAGLAELAGGLARARWTVGRLVTALLRYGEEGRTAAAAAAAGETVFQYLARAAAAGKEEEEEGEGGG